MDTLSLKNGDKILFRPYEAADFTTIQQLNENEGWLNLVENGQETKMAWSHSNIAFVVVVEDQIIGYVRGLTDQHITLFICEILIQEEYRGCGVGSELLRYVHSQYPGTRMEMLASSSSQSFYEEKKFRAFYGFRKTFEE
ncbi:MAG TPA: GNAT family N-acetyltransferase [Bacillales bacterium]|nr:GNAT family N-acetyltransferase [Bacillales bacterium]